MAIVSILTPSFNRADLYTETLRSLQQQSLTNWEEVVVDDGSDDECQNRMQQLICKEPRVRFLTRDREPKGACSCRNIGVEECSGKYVVFLDTDDLLAPHCLGQRVAVMEANPHLDLAIFPAEIFHETPGDAGRWWNVDTDRDLLTRQLHQDAICQGTGCIWKKESFVRIGMWAEHLAIWQDIDLFLRAWIQDYKVKVCFDLPPDLHYREHASLSRVGFHSRPKVESRIRVIRDAVELMSATGKTARIRDVRFMAAETVYGAARGRLFDLATDLLAWGRTAGVFLAPESRTLRRAIVACRSRLIRFKAVRSAVERSLRSFHGHTLLGRVPSSEPLIQKQTASKSPLPRNGGEGQGEGVVAAVINHDSNE